MSSWVFGAVSTAGALQKLLEHTRQSGFTAVNDQQQEWLELLPDYLAALPALDGYVTSMAAPTAPEINDWLSEHGFPDLRLDSWPPDPRAFGVAAVCDVMLTWARAADPARISTELTPGRDYPAANFGAHQGGAVLSTPAGQPVVAIRSQEDLEARIMISDRPGSLADLLLAGRTLLRAKDPAPEQYAGAVVPMIHLDVKPDLTWLAGLRTSGSGTPWFIQQAVQQVTFGLNRTGARLKEATAMGVRESAVTTRRPTYRVDRPFLLTIGRPDLDVPVFTAWVDVDCWADPGELSGL